MKILECEKVCDLSYRSALLTEHKLTDKTGSAEWHAKMYTSEHSPCRCVMFWIVIEVPYWVSVHLVRHKIGIEHFVSSQRNDRQSQYDRTKAPQDAPVWHGMLVNAQALINMSRKRLCNKASPETREAFAMIKEAISKIDKELSERMMPECSYRGGTCPEMRPCNK